MKYTVANKKKTEFFYLIFISTNRFILKGCGVCCTSVDNLDENYYLVDCVIY